MSDYSHIRRFALLAIATVIPCTALADPLVNIDLSYVDTQSSNYARFKAYVDEAVGGDPDYGFTAADAAFMYRLDGGSQYCALAIQITDGQVSDAESSIASGSAPAVARDSYLYAGSMLMDVALTYDWCKAQVTSTQQTRWAAYAEQAIWNIWNPGEAQWGGQPFSWSGWGTNDPGNNYHYSFLQATVYWALANNSTQEWQPFLENVKLPALESYVSTLPGGGSQEGTGYGVAQRKLFNVYRVWRDSTGQDLANANSHETDTIGYWAHATVPTMDRFAPIGDQARSSTPELYDYYRHLILEARSGTADATMKDVASWWLNNISINPMTNSFNYRDDLLPAGSGGSPPASLSYHASGVGVLFARTNWTPGASWMSFVAGPYVQSHAHQDQGSFTLFAGGDWQAVTENIWSHSGINQDTTVHNVVRFVQDGTTVRQTDPTTSEMVVTDGDNGDVHASADLTPAFGGNDAVQNWQRTIDFNAGQLTVSDDYAVSGNTQAIFQINVPEQPTISGNTITAGHMKITVMTPANPTITAVDWTSVSDDFESGWRIDIQGSGGQFVVQMGMSDSIFAGGFESN
jgi:hypothetical protein